MRQIVLDTETTGLSAETGDRILEIGCVELCNRRLTGNDRHYYINPERDSHPDALRVHGLTSEFLKDKPLFKDIATDLVEYLRGSELLIHNAAFDIGFLNKEFELAGLDPVSELDVQITDTLMIARELFPGKRNSLDALCERLNVDNSNRTLHGALLDAQLLADVYINMTRGQHALVIEESDSYTPGTLSSNSHVDLSNHIFPVIVATPEEMLAHDRIMAEIDKESSGKTIWGLVTRPGTVS